MGRNGKDVASAKLVELLVKLLRPLLNAHAWLGLKREQDRERSLRHGVLKACVFAYLGIELVRPKLGTAVYFQEENSIATFQLKPAVRVKPVVFGKTPILVNVPVPAIASELAGLMKGDVNVAAVNFMLPAHCGRRAVFGEHYQLVYVRKNFAGIGRAGNHLYFAAVLHSQNPLAGGIVARNELVVLALTGLAGKGLRRGAVLADRIKKLSYLRYRQIPIFS